MHELSSRQEFDRRQRRSHAFQWAILWGGGIAIAVGLVIALHWNDAVSVAARECSQAGWERTDPAYKTCVQMERRRILIERANEEADQ